jgi:hypothetical protein
MDVYFDARPAPAARPAARLLRAARRAARRALAWLSARTAGKVGTVGRPDQRPMVLPARPRGVVERPPLAAGVRAGRVEVLLADVVSESAMDDLAFRPREEYQSDLRSDLRRRISDATSTTWDDPATLAARMPRTPARARRLPPAVSVRAWRFPEFDAAVDADILAMGWLFGESRWQWFRRAAGAAIARGWPGAIVSRKPWHILRNASIDVPAMGGRCLLPAVRAGWPDWPDARRGPRHGAQSYARLAPTVFGYGDGGHGDYRRARELAAHSGTDPRRWDWPNRDPMSGIASSLQLDAPFTTWPVHARATPAHMRFLERSARPCGATGEGVSGGGLQLPDAAWVAARDPLTWAAAARLFRRPDAAASPLDCLPPGTAAEN